MSDREQNHSKSNPTWLIPVAVVATLLALYLLVPAFRAFVNEAWQILASRDQSRIEEWVGGFGAWSLVVILGLLVIQPFLFVVPSTLMMLVAVLAYGPLLGGLLAWGGSLLAAVFAYGVGRALGPVTVDKLIGHETEEKIAHFVGRYGVWAIIAARVSPVLSTDAISLVAGLVKMRFLSYVLATGIGFLPLASLIAFLGADFERLETGLVWVSVASVAAFILYVVYDRYRQAS